MQADIDEWQATFDPETFTKANQPLSLDRFRLSAEELREWAVRLTRMRAEVEARALRCADEAPRAAEED